MNLTIKEILLFGLKTTKKHYRDVLVIIAIYFLFNLVPDVVTKPLTDSHKATLLLLSFLFSIVFLVFETIFHIGVTKEALKIVRGGKGNIKHVFNYKDLFFRVFFTSVIYAFLILLTTCIVSLPFLLLFLFLKNLIPLYVGTFVVVIALALLISVFGFSKIIVIDRGVTPIEGLKMSKRLTKGVIGRLATIFLALLGFNLLGLIALGVGLVATIPSTFFALLFVYNSLLSRDSVVL